MPIKYNFSSVRHLAWCLFSEPMVVIADTPTLKIEPSQTLVNWLAALDDNPTLLEDYLANHNRVLLGSYFECLWQFFFQHSPDWQLLAHHVQIIEGKQTLGELDIIARNTQLKRDYHIELAVKFYLKQPNGSGELLSDWLGPQSRDRLDIKLDKLSQKQIPFFHHHATQTQLQQRDLPVTPHQNMIMKGYLFEPWPIKSTQYHRDINPNVPCAYWLHYQHTKRLLQHTTDITHWVILPKSHWLGPYQHTQESALTLCNREAIKAIIDHHFTVDPYPYALMLAGMSEVAGRIVELKRFMLVHRDWPTTIKP